VAIESGEPLYKRCLNLSTPASCNWLVPVEDPADMCRACRLNRTIPDLTDPALPDNGYLWGLVELAKRRLVSSLILLGLPVASRMSEDTERGLMFDFLRSPVNGPHIMTGHNTGLITLNVDEADDAKREAVRKAMREPYRTLLGHFRHEVGHYYWDRLVAGTSWMDGFHELFGDETLDYKASLQRNYDEGPPADWPLHYVSAYASTHPWEDWAECWAHYLHMRDAIDTALSFGLSVDHFDLEFTPFTIDALYQPEHPEAEQFLTFLNHWTRLTTMLNEMSRSMGQPDFYPFILPTEAVAKLHFIHLVVSSGSWLQEQDRAGADANPGARPEPCRRKNAGEPAPATALKPQPRPAAATGSAARFLRKNRLQPNNGTWASSYLFNSNDRERIALKSAHRSHPFTPPIHASPAQKPPLQRLCDRARARSVGRRALSPRQPRLPVRQALCLCRHDRAGPGCAF
jgi:hypothetical protein